MNLSGLSEAAAWLESQRDEDSLLNSTQDGPRITKSLQGGTNNYYYIAETFTKKQGGSRYPHSLRRTTTNHSNRKRHTEGPRGTEKTDKE